MSPLLGRLQGLGFLVTLVFTIFAGDTLLIFPMLPLLWLSPYMYTTAAILPYITSRRIGEDWVAVMWFSITCFFFGTVHSLVTSSCNLEQVLNIKFTFTGDRIPNAREPAILLSNHPSRLDWMFLWSFTGRAGCLAKEKIFLKADLKRIPLAGWAMQSFCFIFLRRKWEDDEPYITRSVKHLLAFQEPYQYLLFAEGTDLSPSNLEKDAAFAKERNITAYKHLLHPRTRGFEHLVELLRPVPNAAIWDLTVAYEGLNEYLTESHLARGVLPTKVYMHFKRIDIASVPKGTASGEWLKSHWDAKEKQLQAFHAQQPCSFGGDMGLNTQFAANNAFYAFKGYVVMIFWAMLVALFLYLAYSSLWFKIYLVVAIGSMHYISKYLGGMEVLEHRVTNYASEATPRDHSS